MNYATQSEGTKAATLAAKAHTEREYYYQAFSAYGGTVYKCRGFGAERPEHRAFYEPHFLKCENQGGSNWLPDLVVLKGYRGDRIQRDASGEWVEFADYSA